MAKSPDDSSNLSQYDRKAYAYLPAIVRRQVFWIPENCASNPKKRQKWISSINAFILSLDGALKEKQIFTEYKAPEVLKFKNHENKGGYPPSILIEGFFWRSFQVSIAIELHHEFFTITTSISLQDEDEKYDQDRGEASSVRILADLELSSFSRIANAIHKQTVHGYEQYKEKKRASRKSLRKYHDSFYEEIWRIFDEDFKLRANQRLTPKIDVLNEERLLADIRGLVCIRDAPKMGDDTPPNEENTFFMLGKYQYNPAVSTPSFGGDESVRCAHTVLPFIKAQKKKKGSKSLLYTISKFHNGHCIYTTSLGSSQSPKKIRYFALTTPCNKFQAACLIEDINTLGTLRMAALHDRQALSAIRQKLHKAECKLESVNKAISDIVLVKESKDQDQMARSRLEGFFHGRRIPFSMAGLEGKDFNRFMHEVISAVASELLRQARDIIALGDEVDGGLHSRIEYFRHYHKRFNALLATMNIEHVDGFMPYDRFVARQLGDTYEFLDTLGAEYERIQKTVEALYRQLRALEVIVAQEMSAERTNKMTQLQDGADKLFWLFLFPYYFGHVITGVLEHKKLPAWWPLHETMPLEAMVLTSLFAVGILVSFSEKKIGKIIVLGTLLVLLSGLIAGRIYLPEEASEDKGVGKVHHQVQIQETPSLNKVKPDLNDREAETALPHHENILPRKE